MPNTNGKQNSERLRLGERARPLGGRIRSFRNLSLEQYRVATLTFIFCFISIYCSHCIFSKQK